MPGKEEENEVKGRYGAPGIAAEIQANHQYISVNRVIKYMKRMGLRSKLSRKYRNVNYPEYRLRTCPNHLDRQFAVEVKGWLAKLKQEPEFLFEILGDVNKAARMITEKVT